MLFSDDFKSVRAVCSNGGSVFARPATREPLPNDIAEMRLRVKTLETRAQNATLSQIRQLQSSVEVLSASANGSEFAKALSDAETALKRLAVFF